MPIQLIKLDQCIYKKVQVKYFEYIEFFFTVLLKLFSPLPSQLYYLGEKSICNLLQFKGVQLIQFLSRLSTRSLQKLHASNTENNNNLLSKSRELQGRTENYSGNLLYRGVSSLFGQHFIPSIAKTGGKVFFILKNEEIQGQLFPSK